MPKDFSRDLGYLDKFLQGLRDHAATLGEPAGSRLGELLDEQDRAWAEIKGLLAGSPVTTSSSTTVTPPASESTTESAAPPAAEAPSKRLTVGSLMA
jgi:hypothetical protein